MTSRLCFTLPVALLLAACFPASTLAQHHGGGGSPGHGHTGPGLRGDGRGRLAHRGYGGGAFYPYYWWGDDYGPDTWDDSQEAPRRPVNLVSSRPDHAPAPAPTPADSLLLEYHDGQWVRIPTGSKVPVGPQQYTQSQESTPASKNASAKEFSPPPVKLPPAVLVFRDGHEEEVDRYVVHGNVLYTSADYWTTGSWTRKIPIAELDVPASLKLNAERGGKLSLPTRPNEVVVRF